MDIKKSFELNAIQAVWHNKACGDIAKVTLRGTFRALNVYISWGWGAEK